MGRAGGSGGFDPINVGRVRLPYGHPARDVELRSVSSLGYTDDDLFIVDPRDPRRQVPMRDRHLDALRTVEELRALADLAESDSPQARREATSSDSPDRNAVPAANGADARDTNAVPAATAPDARDRSAVPAANGADARDRNAVPA